MTLLVLTNQFNSDCSCVELSQSMGLGKNIVTHFVKELLVSTVQSERPIYRKVEQFQMTGLVLGKRKYRNQYIPLLRHGLH
jgi:hypothetical protein